MFQYPAFIAAIPWVTGVFVILYVISRRKRRKRIAKLSLMLASDHQGNHCRIRSRIKANLVAAGILFILVALARPQAGFEWREVRSDRHHLLFVLDVSKSMLVADVYPNRLERAKWLIREMVESAPATHMGLLVFAGDSFLQTPITQDRKALLAALENQTARMIPVQGSQFARVFMTIPEMLPHPENDRVILVSDGEDHSQRLNLAIQYLKNQRVRLGTLCVGTTKGGLIPNNESPDDPYFRDDTGKVVFSRANPQRMQVIAGELSGEAVHFDSESQSIRDLIPLLSSSAVSEGEIRGQQEEVPVEAFQWPLLAAFLALCLDLAMGTRKPGNKPVHTT